MKTDFIIDKLDVVKPALGMESPENHFCFLDKKVRANNKKLFIEVDFDLGLDAALPGDLLYKFLSTIKQEVGFTAKDFIVEIGTENKKILNKMQGCNPQDFPVIEDDKNMLDGFTVDEKFIAVLERVFTFAGERPELPQYMGVMVTSDYLYSTNGGNVARHKLSLGLKNKVFLPKAFCAELLRLADFLKEIKIYKNL